MGPALHDEGGSLYSQLVQRPDHSIAGLPPVCIEALSPRTAGSHASKQAGRAAEQAGGTYRPRSVSSLLMRLRAMVVFVGCEREWWCITWVSESGGCLKKRSGLAARELAL